jgi:hypothetical protein
MMAITGAWRRVLARGREPREISQHIRAGVSGIANARHRIGRGSPRGRRIHDQHRRTLPAVQFGGENRGWPEVVTPCGLRQVQEIETFHLVEREQGRAGDGRTHQVVVRQRTAVVSGLHVTDVAGIQAIGRVRRR